jgi:hypothetical protein
LPLDAVNHADTPPCRRFADVTSLAFTSRHFNIGRRRHADAIAAIAAINR